MATKEKNTVNEEGKIQIIEDPVMAVRKLPDVYIGETHNTGFLNMFREILQNSLDIIAKGMTLNYDAICSFDARTLTTIIEDNGPGIPLDMLEKVFSVLHSSSNYDKKAGSGMYSSGKNGMGATITNFLSKFFVVESFRADGTAARVEFKEGYVTDKHTQFIDCPKGKTGLRTSFCPSAIMGEITIDDNDIENLIWQLVHLSKIGTRVIYNAITKTGSKRQSIIANTAGLLEMFPNICSKPLINPIRFELDNGDMSVEALITYDLNEMGDPIILSFANMCPTISGTHVDGLMDGVNKYFKDYMNKIFLQGKKTLTVNNQDIRTGFRAVISVKAITALFTGQSKDIYSEVNMKPFVAKTTLTALDNWAKQNPNDLQKVAKYLKDVCEIRSKQDNQKIKMADKYNVSAITGLPAKYKKHNGKGPFELWITEGDSAAGGLENHRDKNTQAIFPIQGKIPNCLVMTPKRFFENEIIAGLFHVFGYRGYQAKFDPNQFRPAKLVTATDADNDGAHIRCLILLMMLKYLPGVIEAGKVYAALPPLYGAQINGKMLFFANTVQYVEYIQSMFCNKYKIGTATGKTISKNDVVQLLYNCMHYIDALSTVGNMLSVDPRFLEFLLYNRELPYSKLKSTITKQYPYVKDIDKKGSTIVISGLVGANINTVFFNDQFLQECGYIIDLIDRSDKYYTINGNPATLYDIMTVFDNTGPDKVDRYKGLGEMKPELLGTSTVIPGYGRTLRQYTITDVKRELSCVTGLNSDKSQFIKGIKVRKEDIG